MASPSIIKEKKMGIKGMVGKKMTMKTKFMGEDVTITKLTVAEVLEIQDKAKDSANEDSGMEVLKTVIRMSVEDGEELSDSDFNQFPMDELAKLSNAIMKFSGVIGESGK